VETQLFGSRAFHFETAFQHGTADWSDHGVPTRFQREPSGFGLKPPPGARSVRRQ
jgi:hypothetical protein